ncbi:MAG: NDP-hexose 4-ketoreductase, partial [Coriobacteriales bacterium]|nr:NDP-hexose 4-ketoreductase [Coriobacteriales bacterium]
ELKKLFRPEFLNRVDEIVVFKSLTGPQLRGIVDLMVVDLRNRLITQGMSIELTDAARDLVAKEGTDPIYGARPLRRAIQTLIEDPLAEGLLQGEWKPGDIILVDAVDGSLTFARGEGEIPALSERIHMEAPKARERWSTPSIPAPGGLASDAQ